MTIGEEPQPRKLEDTKIGPHGRETRTSNICGSTVNPRIMGAQEGKPHGWKNGKPRGLMVSAFFDLELCSWALYGASIPKSTRGVLFMDCKHSEFFQGNP